MPGLKFGLGRAPGGTTAFFCADAAAMTKKNRTASLGMEDMIPQESLGRPLSPGPNFLEPLGDLLLGSARGRMIELGAAEIAGQALHGIEGVLELMGVLVSFAVAPLFHGAGGRVAKLHGHRFGGVLLRALDRGVQGAIRRVGFGRDSEIDG